MRVEMLVSIIFWSGVTLACATGAGVLIWRAVEQWGEFEAEFGTLDSLPVLESNGQVVK